MPEIQSGSVHALYLFDVAQSIQLDALKAQLGAEAAPSRIEDKAAGPLSVRYTQPPVTVDGRVFDCAELDGFSARIKFYDYGVISLLLSRPFAGTWGELVDLGQTLIESEPLEAHATQACERIATMMQAALSGRRRTFLSEDYLVFAITEYQPAAPADELLATHGRDIAQLLRGERQPLSAQECEVVLRQRFSYFSDDLIVPAWNAALIVDTEPAVRAAIEIVELANSQLLEFRYHDELLEAELTRLYADLQQPRWSHRFAGRRRTLASFRAQTLMIDVNDLTDHLENAVKFTGDAYAARLFSIVGARLGLDHWKRSVEDRLKTLDEIRRFAVEQSGAAQANLLELVIVAILVLELWLFFAGIMR